MATLSSLLSSTFIGKQGTQGPQGQVSLASTVVVNPDINPSVADLTSSNTNLLTAQFSLPRSPNFSVGTVTTGAPGTSASVTDSGSDGDVVLNFTIPRGDTTSGVTSVGINAGNLIDVSGSPITSSGSMTVSVDLSELSTSSTNGDGDYFVVIDTSNNQRKLTKGNINISGFNNDAGYTTNIGDITGVSAGSGLSGGGSSGSVTLSHADTSSQSSVNNSGTAVIQDISLDTYGHVTSLTSKTITTSDLSLGTSNSVRFGSLGIGTSASGTTGEIRATNDITAYYSDDRLKTRIGTIENSLQKISTLDSFYYFPNETAQKLGYAIERRVGLSAQQVQKVLPEAVKPAPIDESYLTVQYDKLVPLLVSAINEMQKTIDTLEKRLNNDYSE
jgi:hypothetical protein